MHYTFINHKRLIMTQNNSKPQNPALRKTAVIGSGFSIWETMPEQQLIERIEEMKGEHAYLEDAIGRAETELFYRKNPDLKRP